MTECRKVKYPSQRSAEEALVAIAEDRLGTVPKLALWAYPCSTCTNSWHLTSQAPSGKPPRWAKPKPITPYLVYDDEASAEMHMDVVYEVDPLDRRTQMNIWVQAMRRLNSIDDPLVRKLITLHSGGLHCGGPARSADETSGWPCDTLRLIADHHGIEHPGRPNGG